ncbi:FKBP9 [Symbiodinium sp. KB8]|nr:FKBP9 [Symbiodinium sp. KB8]
MQTQSPEVAQKVLWERPAKPAGWSAIWEVLPPPPPPPLDQDGVWIWVPEGEEIPVGAIVPHEAFLPHADLEDEDMDLDDMEAQGSAQFGLDEPEHKLDQTTNAGFANPSTFQAWQPFATEATDHDAPSTAWRPFDSHMDVPEDLPVAFNLQSGDVQRLPDSQISAGDVVQSSQQAWQPFSSQTGLAAECGSQQVPQLPASQLSARPAVQGNQQVPQLPGSQISAGPAMQSSPQVAPSSAQQTPREQGWNPWATNLGANEAAFWGSVSGNDMHRRIIGDIGAFDSGDFRSSPAMNSRPSMTPAPAQSGRAWTSGCGVLQANHQEMQSLEGTAFWQLPPTASKSGAFPSGPLSQLQSQNQVRNTHEMLTAPASQGSVAIGSRPSLPSNESAGRTLLTSTSEGLEVTYAIANPPGHAPISTPNMSHLPYSAGSVGNSQRSAGCFAAPWPVPCTAPGQLRGAAPGGLHLLDVTGLYQEPNLAQPGALHGRDVLGPMRPDESYHSRADLASRWVHQQQIAKKAE